MTNLWGVTGAYKDLLSEIEHPAVLMFAVLFHDAGKGAGDSHVERGLELARQAMARIRMPNADCETVEFLIRRHLDLSTAMQSRDLFDLQTVRDVAHQIETVERLKALTLLTYADMSAVNPTVMTPWRAEQLLQLYMIVHAELTRELESERVEEVEDEFLQGFPTRYVRTHTREEIESHLALEQESRKRNGVAVELKRDETAWRLTLIARDRSGLFAAAAGSLSSFGMNILRAEAFANRQGQVLDMFTFEDPLRNLDLNPPEVDRLRTVVERAISGKTDVRDLLRNRPKPQLPSRKARIAGRVAFDGAASQTATLVEIVAEDRPGLLYEVASAMSSSGANIEVVLIDTQAHKAIDVFYVTSAGGKLTEEKQEELATALREIV
jgi:[protein-PII] uridylyltransferase